MNISSISKKLLIGVLLFLLISVAILGLVLLIGPNNIFPCRTWYGKPHKTGLTSDYEFGSEDFKAFRVQTCIVETKSSDPLITIGFFSDRGKLYKYTANLGSREESVMGYCAEDPAGQEEVCSIVGFNDVLGNIAPGEIIDMWIVETDNNLDFWSQDQKGLEYQGFINRFKDALLKTQDFPESLDLLYISQVRN